MLTGERAAARGLRNPRVVASPAGVVSQLQLAPRSLQRVTEHFIGGNVVELLRDGAEAYPAMLQAIAEARRQVLLEMYWFDSDRVGRSFAAALSAAASRGVEVGVIYDAIGSLGADSAMFAELEAAGVRVLEYNPVVPWRRRFRFDRLTRRDHRKILVVDGQVGFTGGINLAEAWLPEADEGGGWRDDMVRIEGPAVAGLTRCFHTVWRRQSGEHLALAGPRSSVLPGGQSVRVLGEAYFRNRRQIARAYLKHLWGARRTAWLTNSYFVPDRGVLRALVAAADRGVDVRVLLPGESDVKIVQWASRAVWGRLLRRGVRIFEFRRNVLHAKTAVIDGRWSTIGTFNLDHLSLLSNLEVNVAVEDERFGESMERSFLRDLEESREVSAREFAFRPLGDRLLEAIAYRFRKFL